MSEEAGTNVGAWVGGTIGVVICIILLLWLLRWIARGRKFTKNIRADDKVIIITGCNTGIGKATVLDLASRGARVYMACRDSKKCEETRQEIIKQTDNNNIFNCVLDLASLESIRTFVKRFLEKETRLDILINNAGIMTDKRYTTIDGFELQMGTNHLGHFLLTNLLLDILKSSAPSRIVVLSSSLHTVGRINRDDLMSEKSYSKWSVYSNTKLANLLFVKEMDKRLQGTGVTINGLHPGVVNTEFLRDSRIERQILMAPWSIFTKSPEGGAQTTLTCALDPDLEKVSGKYFDNCKISKESDRVNDPETAEWLWNISEELTKLNLNEMRY